MDKELLIRNIMKACSTAHVKPTVACAAAGVGKNLMSNMDKGQTPSVAKIADLAAYLGVSTSDLVGDTKTPVELAPLADAWAELNEEGRERLVQYAEDLVATGRYIKSDPAELDQKGGAAG